VQPSPGVYACEVECVGDEHVAWVAPAVVHVGPRPTVDRDETIEAHLIGRTLDLYGKRLRLGFVRRLRGLVRFPDIEGLKRQIEVDIAEAARVLAGGTD
jgi:riboflavin kinase/FMN adenylyltransferase